MNGEKSYNFDKNEQEISQQSPFDILSQDRLEAERVKDKVFYAGLFVDRDELYEKAPAHLKNTVEKPHVTTKFAPDVPDLHLDQLGTNAKIIAIGYGNNGKNEGLLVRIEADDPVIQKAVDALRNPHITLSCSDDSHPMYTIDLDFTPIAEENQFELSGTYSLHMKDDSLVDNRDQLRSI